MRLLQIVDLSVSFLFDEMQTKNIFAYFLCMFRKNELKLHTCSYAVMCLHICILFFKYQQRVTKALE